ncbi:MAG: Crp/Fnr family transcriptional regulator [Anaerolineae bacterium]|jgi:CRP-like cAMP-binding protein|nr:MAG: Crp/Fnr family transcriptional regulator [Anaerolineae bacterium]
MNKDRYLETVRKSSLFRTLRGESFAVLMENGVLRSVEEEAFFFMQGEPATHVYVLCEGRARMVQYTPNGLQITLRLVTPGQTFGGVALLQPSSGYPVTAQAMQDCLAIGWEARFLQMLAEKEPSIALNTMQLMHHYIVELQERQQALSAARVEQRIARTLLKLAAQAGRKTEAGILIDFPLTRQEIAEMCGTTLYTVSRTLNEWERKGLLDIGREKVILLQPHGLVEIAEGFE